MREVNESDVVAMVGSETLTVVDCYAPWCGPCRVLTPRLEALSNDVEFSGVNFVKMNVDDNADFARRHNVRSIPTLIFYKSGQVVHTMMGVPTEKVLHGKITEHM